MAGAFEGRVAMVTGTGRENGIAWAVAEQLGTRGAIVAAGVRTEEEIPVLTARLIEAGIKGMAFELDYTNLAGYESITAKAEDRLNQIRAYAGGLPIGDIVHAAGITKDCPAGRTTEEEWDEVHVVKDKGPFFTTLAAVPDLRQAKPSCVIAITSVVGPVVGNKTQSKYSSANGGMVGWVRSLGAEMHARGVLVAAYAPGLTDTNMTRGTMGDDNFAQMESQVPDGRAFRPGEIGKDLVDFMERMKTGEIGAGALRIKDGGLSAAMMADGSFPVITN